MPAFDSWWLDVKLGVRMLMKYPGLALAGGAGIAIAVAIAAGGFSLTYDLLTSTVPLDEGDRLVSIEMWNTAAGETEPRLLREYQRWREDLKSIQEISAFRILSPNLIAPGAPPESIRVAAMSASGFRVARVRPLIGRYLEDRDEREGAPAVAVIGESVWRNRFGRDAAILGRLVQLGSTPYTIVGVMPEGFAFPFHDRFWVPLHAGVTAPEPLTGPALMVFGRLAPGVTLAGAQAELTALGQQAALAFPKVYTTLQPQVLPYTRPFTGVHHADVSGLLEMQIFCVALLVLVCLNVTILVYTRTAMRQAEIGLRTALGASRRRIVLQLFIEALVLSSVGALAGVALAVLALRSLANATLPVAASLPFWISFRLSPQAVLYAFALSVLAAAIVGIVPALQATRRGLQDGLRVSGGEGLRLGRTWTVLIVAQVGFAVALLPPALASAWNDARDGFAGLGFAAQEFLSVQLGMDSESGNRTGTNNSRKGQHDFARSQIEMMRRLEAEPRVSGVTFSMSTPGNERSARIEGEGGSAHSVMLNRVAVNFFSTFEVPILGGRGFRAADLPSADANHEGGAVVVNLTLARKLFGGQALGRRIRYLEKGPTASREAERSQCYEIVGVVPDFPTGASPGMRDTDQLKVYHTAAAGQVQPVALAIRLRGGSPVTFTQRVREVAVAVDPDLYPREIRGLDEVMRSEQWISRMTATTFVAITASVLLLSSAGIYALMSFTVSQRRKEIGIRLALGAGGKQIIASIFSRALWQLAAGAAVGAALGALFEKASGGVLMRGNAAIVVPVVTFMILTVGILAALGPTRRSLRIAPTEALREQ